MEEVEADSRADPAVGEVEGRIGVTAKVEIDEDDDVAVPEAVRQIADNASAQQAERNLGDCGPKSQSVAPEEYCAQGGRRQGGEEHAAAGKQAPGRPGIAPMDQIKESPHHRNRALPSP